MFDVGEYVVYEKNGVCCVDEITTMNIPGIDRKKLFYVLNPLYTKETKIYTPVENKKVSIRKVLTKEEAMELIEHIEEVETLGITDERQRENQYKVALKSEDCYEWVKIIKTLYVRGKERSAEGKKITSTDERYLRVAENNLYGELAVSLNMAREDMPGFIAEHMKEAV